MTATEVRNDPENGRLVVRWADGKLLQYPYDDLRNACPCAECRGHAPGEVEPPAVRGVQLVRIAEVGTYALRFSWSDGHSTGIYTWGFLREVGVEALV
jgi:DUF971 family protein